MAEEEEEEEIMAVEIYCNSLPPQEIIIEILSWLPAKSLVTSFKLVCKAWRTLIHDPVFVKMHLNRGAIHGGVSSCSSNNNNNNNSLICKSGNDLFQLHPPFNFEATTIAPAAASATIKLDFDSSLLLSNSRLVCSCNGLLCLSIEHGERIILLNPSTRRFKVSPIRPLECSYLAVNGFGCCYNSIDNIDEYKVIRIECFSGLGKFSARIVIYSMSSDSWTRLRDYPYFISNQQSGVFLNGDLHWMGYGTTPEPSNEAYGTIVSFDIRDEEFQRQVPIPLSFEPTADNPSFGLEDRILMNMRGNPSFGLEDRILMNMRGCLAMIWFSNRNNNMGVDLEIWVMKEYGIKESWTEEFVIRSADSDPPRALYGFGISWRSNAYVLKGDQILIEGRKGPGSYKVLYDINKRKIDGDFLKIVGVPDEPNNVDQVDYIETLVSLKSINASFEQQ